jgi:hypothetical protein
MIFWVLVGVAMGSLMFGLKSIDTILSTLKEEMPDVEGLKATIDEMAQTLPFVPDTGIEGLKAAIPEMADALPLVHDKVNSMTDLL